MTDKEGKYLPLLASGAVAGLLASVPMAGLLLLLHHFLPPKEKYALPPEIITRKMAAKTGLDTVARKKEPGKVATWAAHLGYGAATGSLYPVTAGRIRSPWWVQGALFAVGVWSASYLGWLPAAKILPPATEVPARRNLIMILGHLLWGGLIAVLIPPLYRTIRERAAQI